MSAFSLLFEHCESSVEISDLAILKDSFPLDTQCEMSVVLTADDSLSHRQHSFQLLHNQILHVPI